MGPGRCLQKGAGNLIVISSPNMTPLATLQAFFSTVFTAGRKITLPLNLCLKGCPFESWRHHWIFGCSLKSWIERCNEKQTVDFDNVLPLWTCCPLHRMVSDERNHPYRGICTPLMWSPRIRPGSMVFMFSYSPLLARIELPGRSSSTESNLPSKHLCKQAYFRVPSTLVCCEEK